MQAIILVFLHLEGSKNDEDKEHNDESIEPVKKVVAQPVTDGVDSTHKLKVFGLYTMAARESNLQCTYLGIVRLYVHTIFSS